MTPQPALDPSPLSNLVGNSAAIKQVQRQALRISKVRLPVLILGETGTGKGIIAKAIHDLDNLGRFVTVDCASMVGTLMESIIFGHLKGSFTGAYANQPGLLDQANGGTAFFDEIGELPLDLQVKLLTVLQEKEFRAIGSNVTRTSNFRVIAATNRDLESEVERRRFRQDLYYRLNVAKIRMPALRDRKEDIPLLVAHFIERHGKGHLVPDDVMRMLCEYDWPGNVRELENTIQKMVAMNSGPSLSIADLPTAVVNWLLEKKSASSTAGEEITACPVKALDRIIPLEDLIKRAVLEALQFTKGDRTMAALLLGIGRTTLYRKLKEYGM